MSEVSGSGREELPRVGGQGQPGDTTSHRRPGVVTLRSHPEPEARASGWEEHPEVAAQAQEGLEELSQVEGQQLRQ